MTALVPSVRGLLGAAREGGYAVPALNILDVATIDGVLRAAADARSPVIVQTAAVTARTWGPSTLDAAFRTLRDRHGATAILQLDHCDDRAHIDACLEAGYDAVLFDGVGLPPARNRRVPREVVDRAHAEGAQVEGSSNPSAGSNPARRAPGEGAPRSRPSCGSSARRGSTASRLRSATCMGHRAGRKNIPGNDGRDT
jgi:Fructose-bisphosphate aldolase class-II